MWGGTSSELVLYVFTRNIRIAYLSMPDLKPAGKHKILFKLIAIYVRHDIFYIARFFWFEHYQSTSEITHLARECHIGLSC